MANTNICCLLGRLVKDAELVPLNQGNSWVVKFVIAVNDDVKKGDKYEQRPNFFEVDYFGNYAKKIVESMKKGRELLVEGKLRQDRWSTPEGKTSSRVLIRADKVTLLREPGTGKATGEAPAPVSHDNEYYTPSPEDNPFED